jgi:hypothetical protein
MAVRMRPARDGQTGPERDAGEHGGVAAGCVRNRGRSQVAPALEKRMRLASRDRPAALLDHSEIEADGSRGRPPAWRLRGHLLGDCATTCCVAACLAITRPRIAKSGSAGWVPGLRSWLVARPQLGASNLAASKSRQGPHHRPAMAREMKKASPSDGAAKSLIIIWHTIKGRPEGRPWMSLIRVGPARPALASCAVRPRRFVVHHSSAGDQKPPFGCAQQCEHRR